jgi:hypothetical protein
MALAHFTTLLPVEAGREEALRKTLADLGTGGASPFHGLAGTHMARLYILDHYGGSRRGVTSHRRLAPVLLVFSAVVDGEAEAWLGRLHARIGSTAEAIWSHCAGFPGIADGSAFAGWLLDHELAPTLPIIAHRDATVESVQRGLSLRSRLGDLAGRVQGAAPAVVRAAYRQVFDP